MANQIGHWVYGLHGTFPSTHLVLGLWYLMMEMAELFSNTIGISFNLYHPLLLLQVLFCKTE